MDDVFKGGAEHKAAYPKADDLFTRVAEFRKKYDPLIKAVQAAFEQDEYLAFSISETDSVRLADGSIRKVRSDINSHWCTGNKRVFPQHYDPLNLKSGSKKSYPDFKAMAQMKYWAHSFSGEKRESDNDNRVIIFRNEGMTLFQQMEKQAKLYFVEMETTVPDEKQAIREKLDILTKGYAALEELQIANSEVEFRQLEAECDAYIRLLDSQAKQNTAEVTEEATRDFPNTFRRMIAESRAQLTERGGK